MKRLMSSKNYRFNSLSIVLVICFAFLGSVQLKGQAKKHYDTNLFEIGDSIKQVEDNLKNLFINFPKYVTNAKDFDLISYGSLGTVNSTEEIKEYLTKNLSPDNLVMNYNYVKISPNMINYPTECKGSSIVLIPIEFRNVEDSDKVDEIIKTLSSRFVNVGDYVYVITYLYNLVEYQHYIFINSKTNKVVRKANIFGFDVPITHVISVDRENKEYEK